MNKDIIERFIKEYGRITQSVICMEECSELIQAVSKQIRGIGSKESLIEEMADVTICLEMLKDIYDIDDTEIGQQIQYKQDCMEQRMDRKSTLTIVLLSDMNFVKVVLISRTVITELWAVMLVQTALCQFQMA